MGLTDKLDILMNERNMEQSGLGQRIRCSLYHNRWFL